MKLFTVSTTAVAVFAVSAAFGSSLDVRVNAPWTQTPILAEASEAVAAFDAAAFWSFVDMTAPAPAEIRKQRQAEAGEAEEDDSEDITAASSQLSQYARALGIIPALLASPAQQQVARAEIAARAFSPLIRAHHDLALRALNTSDAAKCAGGAFFDIGNAVVTCDPQVDLEAALREATDRCDEGSASPYVAVPGEHVFDGAIEHASVSPCDSPVVVLYGVLGTEETAAFVKTCRRAAKTLASKVVFRHYTPQSEELEYPVALQGFGVTVDVKSMEYKAVNEDEKAADGSADSPAVPSVEGVDLSVLLERLPAYKEELKKFAVAASEASKNTNVGSDLDMKLWDLQRLGLQAANAILSSPSPLDTFIDLSENFPARVGRLSRAPIDEAFHATEASITTFQMQHPEATNSLWFNGRVVEPHHTDLFTVLQHAREEEVFGTGILQALSGGKARDRSISGSRAAAEAVSAVKQAPVKASTPKDAPRLWVPEKDVYWANDVAKDAMYKRLPKKMDALLRPGMFGQPTFTRHNLLNFIYVVDPTDLSDIQLAVSFFRIYQNGVAARFGFMFAFPDDAADTAGGGGVDNQRVRVSVDEDGNMHEASSPSAISSLMAAAMYELQRGKDKMQPLMFLMHVGSQPLTSESITIAAQTVGLNVVAVTKESEEWRKQCLRKTRAVGLRTTPAVIINGALETEQPDMALYNHFQAELDKVKELVKSKKLKEGTKTLYDDVMEQVGAVKRYQPAIFDNVQFADLTDPAVERVLGTSAGATYLYPNGFNYEFSDLSHVWTMGAFDSSAAALAQLDDLLLTFLGNCNEGEPCSASRATVVACGPERLSHVIVALLHAVGQQPEKKRLALFRTFVTGLRSRLDAASSDDDVAINKAVNSLVKELGPKYDPVLQWSTDYQLTLQCQACLALRRTVDPYLGASAALFTNGRQTVLDATIVVEDFATLELSERAARAKPLESSMKDLDYIALSGGKLDGEDVTNEFISTKLATVSSLVARDLATRGPKADPETMPQRRPGEMSRNSFNAGPMGADARHRVVVILDPVSRPAQKIVGLLNYLTTVVNASVEVHLNPMKVVQKIPIKNYYRFVVSPEVHFNGTRVAPTKVALRTLPTNVVLTLGIDDPDSWMVFASNAEDDLDNLKLSHDKETVAEYELQSILVTGKCTDRHTGAPPRGLPIVMKERDHSQDTLVMSNYGYFQLQGLPGLAMLSIQPGGRADTIYAMTSLDGMSQTSVVLTSFMGVHVELEVDRRPGMERAQLLAEEQGENGAVVNQEDDDESGGFLSSLFGNTKPAGKAVAWPITPGDRPERPERPTLNIFSLASGHLYERFLRLMIHTVMQSSSDRQGANTTRIKFWLIENPMSPRFKKLLPHLAAKYGFEYGLVKYKWPHWLTRQTEKQRMIWAYKVLFLDVLFPMDVEKIIFVDADQIVRSDLHELYNLDLQGKPVAYTPFCRVAKREETAGFRFWDEGYWKNHLRGRPYHISAIYVVDLLRLRRIAAGDRYRMIYDGLAQDPNSLANLDQDLPNFAQHQVPIHSLPEEWLWCETWCNDASKEKAKTIDLCNNPKTKTPKLENAKRIIPEWEAMDRELQEFEDSVLGTK